MLPVPALVRLIPSLPPRTTVRPAAEIVSELLPGRSPLVSMSGASSQDTDDCELVRWRPADE